MSQIFDRSGVRFEFPHNWKLEFEEAHGGWTATVYSPDTAFFLISFHPDAEDAGALADTALEALRESYPDLESEAAMETLAGEPAIGHDVDFMTLDLANSCLIRSLAAPVGSLLLLSQWTDIEPAVHPQVLRAIRASLTVEDD